MSFRCTFVSLFFFFPSLIEKKKTAEAPPHLQGSVNFIRHQQTFLLPQAVSDSKQSNGGLNKTENLQCLEMDHSYIGQQREPTVAKDAAPSSIPKGPLTLNLMYNLMRYTMTVQVAPTTAAMTMRPAWSVVVTAKLLGVGELMAAAQQSQFSAFVGAGLLGQ